jgi:hypothetical protein
MPAPDGHSLEQASGGAAPRNYLRLRREFAWPTVLLAVAGLALLFWREPSLGWLFLSALLLEWAFSFTYRIDDYAVFYIIGYLLLAMLAGYGAARGAAGLARLPLAGARLVAVAGLLAVLVLGISPQLTPYIPAARADRIAFLGDPGYLVDFQEREINSTRFYQVERREVQP